MIIGTGPASGRIHAAPPDAQGVLWQSFTSATSADVFCQSWLGLVALQVPSARLAAVLVESDTGQAFLPIAVWPAASKDFARLGPAIQKALAQKKACTEAYDPAAVVAASPQPAAGPPPGLSSTAGLKPQSSPVAPAMPGTHIAYPILLGERPMGAVALELATRQPDQINLAMRQLHWGIAWLNELFMRRELEQLSGKAEQVGSVMETLAVALREGPLKHMLFEVVNQIARQQGFSRVAIGLERHHQVRPQALSDNAWFNKNVALLEGYAAAMEACHDQRQPLCHPPAPAPAPPAPAPTPSKDGPGTPAKPSPTPETTADVPLADPAPATSPALAALARDSGARAILALPLLQGVRCVGVLTVEHDQRETFSEAEQAWLSTLASLLPAAIAQKQKAEQGYWGKLSRDGANVARKLFGPRHLVWKAAALGALLVIGAGFVPMAYQVNARTVVEGQTQRVIPMPFEGFLIAASARAGDTVKAGEELAQLDDKDLKVELVKARSERNQYERKLREAMANHDLANTQVIRAQLQQAEAQQTLVEEKLRRSSIVAPMDGVIVSGDLSQQIGSPMEQGKKLFEISPLDHYRVILQVEEHDIRQIKTGQPGQLRMTGLAHQPIDFSVSKITPVASTDEGKNVFRVEAELRPTPGQALPDLRPGMEGVGKITTAEQPLGWILGHKLLDWLRLQLWNWLP